MKNSPHKIAFTGGGSGGHLFPIVSISREIKKLYDGNQIKLYYIGPKECREILSQENFKTYSVLTGKLRRYFSLKNVIDILFNLPIGYVQSFFLLLLIRPHLVFSKGGSGSFQICLAARHLRIPVFLHESDSVPGLSNKKAGKWAKKIFISFPKTENFSNNEPILVGNPIRTELLNGSKEIAKAIFQIKSNKPVILIIGGSQGAQVINEFLITILNDLLRKYEVIHVAGEKNYKIARISADLILLKDLISYYHLYESLDEKQLSNAYAISDFVMSRAGSGIIFEIAAVGKPSILVPLPASAFDHQIKNAYQYANTGAAIVIEQNNLTPNFFLGQLENLLSQPQKIKVMKEQAIKFSKPEAAQTIAKVINFMYK